MEWVLGNWQLVGFILSTLYGVFQSVRAKKYDEAIQKIADAWNDERLKGQVMREAIESKNDKSLKETVENSAIGAGVGKSLHNDVVADKERKYASPLHELYERNQTVKKTTEIIKALSGLTGIFSKRG